MGEKKNNTQASLSAARTKLDLVVRQIAGSTKTTTVHHLTIVHNSLVKAEQIEHAEKLQKLIALISERGNRNHPSFYGGQLNEIYNGIEALNSVPA